MELVYEIERKSLFTLNAGNFGNIFICKLGLPTPEIEWNNCPMADDLWS